MEINFETTEQSAYEDSIMEIKVVHSYEHYLNLQIILAVSMQINVEIHSKKQKNSR